MVDMANYKEEIAKIILYGTCSGRGLTYSTEAPSYVKDAEDKATEILRVLSSGELPLTPGEIEDTFAEYESIQTSSTDFIKAGAERQLKKLQPIIAAKDERIKELERVLEKGCMQEDGQCIYQDANEALKAENEKLKNGKVALQMAAQLLLQDILELKLQLSTARAEVEELKKNVDIYEELLANVLDVMNEADVELPYLAPDKGGK